jgi:phage-related protein
VLSEIKESNRKYVIDFFASIAELSTDDKDEIIRTIFVAHKSVLGLMNFFGGVKNEAN